MPTEHIDAIELEVLRNALQSVADEMGATLRNTAFSPNIKERMDASCAVFDARGQLVAQAEHVPVHLGSMLSAIGGVLRHFGAGEPWVEGDVAIVNDPFLAGAHLPDVTLLAPVFAGASTPLAFVATRAHHADVGGMAPGSMPGNSTEVYQEGLVIPPLKLVRAGQQSHDVMAFVLANVRTPDERAGDIDAQSGALATGVQRIGALVERHGAPRFAAGMEAVLDYAEQRMRARIVSLPDGTYAAEDQLDDDGSGGTALPVRVTLSVQGDTMSVDFTGSAPACRGNINAVAPMVHSAVFFAVKVFTDPDIPVNAGTFRAIDIAIPGGSLLDAQAPAAVCAGNTETTQRVCDTVLRAAAQLAPERVHAASQGTMNLIGIGGTDPRTGAPYTYVETVAGGEGGRPWGPGTDGVQCNMTNTLNTPIEALEIAYPLRVERYEFRDGSGGAGRYRGGHGVERVLRAIDHDAEVTLCAERRAHAPYGLHGGADGTPGEDAYLAADGSERPLPAKTTFTLRAGDAVRVRTPGGGGFGTTED